MDNQQIFIVLALATFSTTAGLQCFSCKSSSDNDDCNWQGLKECNDGEVCMNTLKNDTYENTYSITKTCTEKSLCQNLFQLKPCTNSADICYECCTTNGCNHALGNEEDGAESESELFPLYLPNINKGCGTLSPIEFGTVMCTGETLGNICVTSCEDGYMLTSYSSQSRTCTFTSPMGYYWSGDKAVCAKMSNKCTDFFSDLASSKLIELTPKGVVYSVTIKNKVENITEWTVVVEMAESLDETEYIETFGATLSDITNARLTFTNAIYNGVIFAGDEKEFVFIIKSKSQIKISDKFFNHKVGFMGANPCNAQFNIPETTTPWQVFVTQDSSLTTIDPPNTSTTTTTTQAPTTTTTVATTTGVSLPDPDSCTVGTFILSKSPYESQSKKGRWFFAFKVVLPKKHYFKWLMKIHFNKDIGNMVTFNFKSEKSETNPLLWTFRSTMKTYEIKKSKKFVGVGIATVEQDLKKDNGELPRGAVIICNDVIKAPVLPTLPSATHMNAEVGNRCAASAASGVLPKQSGFTDATFFKKSEDGEKYDYNELIHKSLLFYEAQRAGYMPKSNRIPWRGHTALKDGCDNGIDLVGGYFDAGDHVKFGFPMAATITVISWGVIEFKEAYVDVEEYKRVLEMIKWGTDYFVKAHTAPNELYVQVGDGQPDHDYWGHPETMKMKRPSYKIDEKKPGSEVAAETAAALASASLVFKNEDEEYAKVLLAHAVQLFNFADRYRRQYHQSIPQAEKFYKSWSGYEDELAWAAMWLYKATKETSYMTYATKLINKLSMHEFSWDGKGPGVMALLAQEQPSYIPRLRDAVASFMKIQRTPGGLSWLLEWGPNRYAANYAFISLVTAKILKGGPKESLFHDYAEQQIHTMLGSGDNDRSYVVGFGKNPPQRPHHRSSSCPPWTSLANAQCTWNDLQKQTPNIFTLYGALVGGPSNNGHYKDVRTDYKLNEVAMDYNSGYQSALAGLKYFVMQKRKKSAP